MLPKTRCLQTKWKRWLWRVRLLAFVPIELSGSIRIADHKHWRHTNLWVISLTFKTYLKCSKKRSKTRRNLIATAIRIENQPTPTNINQCQSTFFHTSFVFSTGPTVLRTSRDAPERSENMNPGDFGRMGSVSKLAYPIYPKIDRCLLVCWYAPSSLKIILGSLSETPY